MAGRWEGRGFVFGLAGAAVVAGALALFYQRAPSEPELTRSITEQVLRDIGRRTPIATLNADDIRYSSLRVTEVGADKAVTGFIEIRRREFEAFKGAAVSPSEGWFKTRFVSTGKLNREDVLNAAGRSGKRDVWYSHRIELTPAGFWAQAMAAWETEKSAANIIFDGWIESLRILENPSEPSMSIVQESLTEKEVAWLLTARDLRRAGKFAEAKKALRRADLAIGRHEWAERARQEAHWAEKGIR